MHSNGMKLSGQQAKVICEMNFEMTARGSRINGYFPF